MQLVSATALLITGKSHRLSQPMPTLQHVQEKGLYESIKKLQGWQTLPSILSSRNSSPATQRCSLQFLFAAYVLSPQLGHEQPPGSTYDPLLKCLYDCIDGALNRRSFLITSTNSPSDEITVAMFICLFATVYTVVAEGAAYDAIPTLRPRSFGFLLELIISITGYPVGEPCVPLKNLTSPQNLLLRWGSVLPWAWNIWQDQRAADSEHIVFLTANWMFHIDGLSAIVKQPSINFDLALQQTAGAYGNITLELYRSLSRLICVPSQYGTWSPHGTAVVTILTKCTVSFITLLRSYYSAKHIVHGTIMACCECILGLFCYVGDSEEEMCAQELILEALLLVPASLMKTYMKEFIITNKVDFLSRLDKVIEGSSREDEIQVTDDLLRGVELVLQFVLFLWHTDPTTKTLFTGELLISRALRYLKSYSGSEDVGHFRSSLISVASLILPDLAKKQKKALECLILDAVRDYQDLTCASAISMFLLQSNGTKNPAILISAWDYLRTALSLILTGNYLCEERPLALVVSSAVCHALYKAITSSPLVERVALSSPWSMSFIESLRVIMEEDAPDEYSSALREQLSNCGSALLSRLVDGGSREEIQAAPNIVLVYFREMGYGRMVARCMSETNGSAEIV
ncbi:hypothetical protein DFP72DRAFT_866211 [Ephemerocybe angulata]|uniref:Uncharacterized protein n=1 Tax=Ephemerocybe angulata TaxID=980116 RepID=A0A8H6IKI6_9AGAR|nr:hypothetical protein DFP72DRAFT_866211 [Tulosesus angulatus]